MHKNTFFYNKSTLNIGGRLTGLQKPLVMGILNITPDSFHDGGRNNTLSDALHHCEKMLSQGAELIDIGAYSSRPSAEDIPAGEEWNRLAPVLKGIRARFPEALISIDTFRAEIAKNALEEGAAIINDISAGQLDPAMFGVIKHYKPVYCMMHMRGTPKTMASLTDYKDLVREIIDYFTPKISELQDAGVHDLIIDPGFGFAKSIEQNFELLAKMETLHLLGHPILAGLSRKSMIYKTLDITPGESLNGTTALNMIALQKGAKLLRVHDVKEAVECISLFTRLEKYDCRPGTNC